MPGDMKDYVDNFRADLPSEITYDSTVARYFFNGKRFLNEWEVSRYREYLLKTDFYYVNGLEPGFVADFAAERYEANT
jgi:hypothetical protein